MSPGPPISMPSVVRRWRDSNGESTHPFCADQAHSCRDRLAVSVSLSLSLSLSLCLSDSVSLPPSLLRLSLRKVYPLGFAEPHDTSRTYSLEIVPAPSACISMTAGCTQRYRSKSQLLWKVGRKQTTCFSLICSGSHKQGIAAALSRARHPQMHLHAAQETHTHTHAAHGYLLRVSSSPTAKQSPTLYKPTSNQTPLPTTNGKLQLECKSKGKRTTCQTLLDKAYKWHWKWEPRSPRPSHSETKEGRLNIASRPF